MLQKLISSARIGKVEFCHATFGVLVDHHGTQLQLYSLSGPCKGHTQSCIMHPVLVTIMLVHLGQSKKGFCTDLLADDCSLDLALVSKPSFAHHAVLDTHHFDRNWHHMNCCWWLKAYAVCHGAMESAGTSGV